MPIDGLGKQTSRAEVDSAPLVFFDSPFPPLLGPLILDFPTKGHPFCFPPSYKMAAENGAMQVFKATVTAEPSPEEPSPEKAPEGPDDMWTERLANQWKEVEFQVRRLAQASRGKYDPNLEIPGVMANLERVQKKTKDKTKTKWSQFKKHLTNTLTVIGKVGGMASDAASQVSLSIRIEKESVTKSKKRYSLQLGNVSMPSTLSSRRGRVTCRPSKS